MYKSLNRWKSLLTISLLLFTTGLRAQNSDSFNSNRNQTPPLILISIDGFRADYLARGITPTLASLRQQGAYAKVMRPSFPSLTFPNHYTLVTGLRPDRHGIVANTMDDPHIPGVRFSLGNKEAVSDSQWWNQAEPIWVSAEKHGLASATMFWPGSEAAIHGVRPSEWRPFDGKFPANSRVDTLLGWLDKPVNSRPRFLTLYFDDIDHAGHDFGPDSVELDQSLRQIDQAIARLISGLAQRQIQANLILVSDHGMSATHAERVIYLNQIVASNEIQLLSYGAMASLRLRTTQPEQTEVKLLGKHAHMSCWRKQEIPEHFGYGKNARVADIICLAEPGWLIMAEPKAGQKIMAGSHGYDHRVLDMAALFIAVGPSFRVGAEIDEMQNTDVYPLIMHLLQLPAQPNQGSLANTAPLLKP